MAKVSTNIALDAELKKASQELFADLGMDLTTAITIFLKQAVREQGIPFPVKRYTPKSETKAALDEYAAIREHPELYKRYSNFNEALEDIDSDI